MWTYSEAYAGQSIALGGQFVYALVTKGEEKSRVVKINSSTMATTGVVDCAAKGGTELVLIGKYLYISHYLAGGIISKIDVDTMKLVGSWAYPDLNYGFICIASDGTYLYVGTNAFASHPARVIKVKAATMSFASEWQSGWGASAWSLTHDGHSLYSGRDGHPGCVAKIDPNIMTKVAEWTGAHWKQNLITALTNTGSYIYAMSDQFPSQIIKINPSSMQTVAIADLSNLNEGHANSQNLATDGDYVYATPCLTNPAQVAKIDVSSMAIVGIYTGEGKTPWAVACDSNYLYLILAENPARVTKIRSDTMTEATVAVPKQLIWTIVFAWFIRLFSRKGK